MLAKLSVVQIYPFDTPFNRTQKMRDTTRTIIYEHTGLYFSHNGYQPQGGPPPLHAAGI